ncbi:RAS-2 [Fusarium mundagurra]|uniref:RAS-2 n=1 Tax=Fusarium mundagurra TaxID=1567541 RepID=A0A8H5XUE1_9HYPO|nr:RAS-2 [Fusarium mundagurra]
MMSYKLVVLGDGGVGKTALIFQLCLGLFVGTCDPTIEDSYMKSLHIDGLTCMLEIFDTAGQEEYEALRKQWIAEGEAILLVYSITSRASFRGVGRFFNEIQAASDGKHTPICLVGNKSDRATEREVSTTEGFELAQTLGIASFVECSAKNSANVEYAFHVLIRSLRTQQANASEPYKKKQTLFRSQLIIPAGETETFLGRSRLANSLVQAARSNDLKAASDLLNAGASINAQSSSSGSALHAAAGLGHLAMVNLLIKSGAGINVKGPLGSSPPEDAAAGGHLGVAQALIQKGANCNQTSVARGTALHAAASRGHAAVVKHLLRQGANPNVKAGPYEYALHAGAWFGSVAVVNALLDGGAEIGKLTTDGCTALHMAALTGNADVIEVLVDRGATIHINVVSPKFGTALDAADDNGHFKVVEFLLHQKAKKSGLQLTTMHNPNLSGPLKTDREEGASSSTDNIGVHDEQNKIRERTCDITVGTSEEVFLTSEYEFSLSTSQQAFTNINSKPPIQDTGFTTIYNPPEARSEYVIDAINSGTIKSICHPEKTWTFKSEPEIAPPTWRERLLLQRRKQRAVGSHVYWPYDLLCQQEEFMSSRIMTWGYDTKVIRELFAGSDSQNISQHGNNLMVRLQQERRDNRTFLQMLEDGHFTIHSFFETLPMRGIKGLKGLVVPYESAIVGHAKKEILLGVTATHASICKFSGPSDPGYQAVVGALRDYVRAAAIVQVDSSVQV